MTRSKIYIMLTIFCTLLFSCIENYTPQIDTDDIAKYVVSGQITDQEGYQTVSVSMTSAIGTPKFIPVNGCKIDILDNLGNIFPLTQYTDGKYHAWVDKPYLNTGTSYQVNIITPDGTHIASDYDEMPECPQLDSLYYIKEDPTVPNPYFDKTEGIRFYVDMNGTNADSRYMRWELEETWEYHASYYLYEYIDATGHHYVDPLDLSRYVCWKTETIKDIFTLTTNNLSQNIYKKFPLNYLDNHTDRLQYGYYISVKQLAISEDAFLYWEQLRLNSSEQGGLYEKQPLPVKGNIKNITNPEQEVLGFFEASSVNTKNLFVGNIENIDIVLTGLSSYCSLIPLRGLPKTSSPPIYLTRFPCGARYEINRTCWDCLSRGGTNIKPDFWPL